MHRNNTEERAKPGQKKMAPKDALWLSTVHQAKGLEWATVLVPRFNEKSFPCIFDEPPANPAAAAAAAAAGAVNDADDDDELDEDGAVRLDVLGWMYMCW